MRLNHEQTNGYVIHSSEERTGDQYRGGKRIKNIMEIQMQKKKKFQVEN
jgi:hypothetical protein